MTTPIEAGEKTKRITIQQATKTQNALNETTTTWTVTRAKRWAKVETLTGKELAIAQQQVANVTHKITFEFVSGLTTEDRISLGDHVFGIDLINDRDFAGVEHVVLAKENP